MRINKDELYSTLALISIEVIDVYEGGFPASSRKNNPQKILEICNLDNKILKITDKLLDEKLNLLIEKGGIYYFVVRPRRVGSQGRNLYYEVEFAKFSNTKIIDDGIADMNISNQNKPFGQQSVEQLIKAAETRLMAEYEAKHREFELSIREKNLANKEKDIESFSGKFILFAGNILKQINKAEKPTTMNAINPKDQANKETNDASKEINSAEDITSIRDAISVLIHFAGKEFLIELAQKVIQDPSIIDTAKKFL